MELPEELKKYFDEHGSALLANEHQLERWGLMVVKEPFGTLQIGPATLALYDLTYRRRDKEFSSALISYLKNEIQISPEQIAKLQSLAVYDEKVA
jgi:hypothetical protein